MARLTNQNRIEFHLTEARRLAQDVAKPQAVNPHVRPSDSRDSDPLDRLVREHHPSVTRLAHRLLGWQGGGGDVDDVVHDVFLAAFKQKDRFRGEASEWTWLAAITINRCRTHRRRQLLRFKWLSSFRGRREEASDQATADRDETAARARNAVMKLPPRDREVIVLHHLEEMSIAQVAELTGDSIGAIEVRLHRARKRLKEMLEGKIDE